MKVFLDLDGVFANFAKKADEVLGVGTLKHNPAYGWCELSKHDNLFYHLEVISGSLELWKAVRHLDVEFLTALPWLTGKLDTAPADKRLWVGKHINHKVKVNTVPGSEFKSEYLTLHPGAVLIDDYDRNIRQWSAKGGIGILHTTVSDTLTQLNKIGLI